jgi:prepilin-type N-terminal cleavage/methylation domain-containing protein
MQINIKKQLGFTLVEMAIVLVIAGALLTAGLKIASAVAERSAVSVTKQHQEAIKEALISYIAKMGRLPCPDQNATPDGLDNDRDASTPALCNAYSGTVPYKDLGLEREVVIDGWDNYITYVMSPLWRLTYNASAVAGDQYQTSTITDAFWPGVRAGAITVYTRIPATSATTTKIADPATNTGAAVALISYGPNGSGARNLSNAVNTAPAAGTDEAANATIVNLEIYKRDFIDQDVPTYGAFDDVVMVISPDDINAPLVKSGAAQDASLASMLALANKHVIGQIATTRDNCTVPICGTASQYYYTYPASITNFPAQIQAWGVTYTPNTETSSAGCPNSSTTTCGDARLYLDNARSVNSYTISVNAQGSSLSKTITLQELKGIMSTVSGFN